MLEERFMFKKSLFLSAILSLNFVSPSYGMDLSARDAKKTLRTFRCPEFTPRDTTCAFDGYLRIFYKQELKDRISGEPVTIYWQYHGSDLHKNFPIKSFINLPPEDKGMTRPIRVKFLSEERRDVTIAVTIRAIESNLSPSLKEDIIDSLVRSEEPKSIEYKGRTWTITYEPIYVLDYQGYAPSHSDSKNRSYSIITKGLSYSITRRKVYDQYTLSYSNGGQSLIMAETDVDVNDFE